MNQQILADCGYTCEEVQEAATIIAKSFAEAMKVPYITDKKETPTMQVTYNGLTGKLLKMEFVCENYYDITIYDAEKEAKVSFSGVKFEDMKFRGGAVTFGG